MTERQARYVEHICREAGRTFDPEMSRAEAQEVIKEHGKGWLTSDQVRKVACPKCGAESNLHCWGWTKRGESRLRKSHHIERVKAARAKREGL